MTEKEEAQCDGSDDKCAVDIDFGFWERQFAHTADGDSDTLTGHCDRTTSYLKVSPTDRRATITLKSAHKNVVVNLDDMLFIEAMDNYVKVFRTGLPMVISQITMKEMEEMLPAERFLRVHRSYIVSLDAIERFSNRQIYLSGHKSPIPVGRKYSETFNNIHNNKIRRQ
jgi:DNA-binding LytR/AlgR family response regulator